MLSHDPASLKVANQRVMRMVRSLAAAVHNMGRVRKRMSDALALELWMVVNPWVGARNQTWVLCKSSSSF